MIGILPAAGNATRINGLPKMLLPIGDTFLMQRQYQNLRKAGCGNVFVGTNSDNHELVARQCDTSYVIPFIAHSRITMSATVISTHTQAIIHRYKGNILFAMPDTYIEDELCFEKLSTAINGDCDVAVALFHARHDQRRKGGMCRTQYGKVIEVVDKPEETDMVWIWGALAWKPVFWEYINANDPHVGYALPKAIAAGLDVRAVRMDGEFWDCGTAAEYYELIQHLAAEKVAE